MSTTTTTANNNNNDNEFVNVNNDDATTNSTKDDNNDDPMYGLPRPLLLGSASFTRKLILKQMGISDYHILVRSIDEKMIGDRSTYTPDALVHAVAHAKMNHLIHEILSGNCNDELPTREDDINNSNNNNSNDKSKEEWIIMTADQVVTCQGRILEKPNSIEEAKEFVTLYGLYPCSTVGCVVITHLPSRTTVSSIHTATIHFKSTLTSNVASHIIDTMIQQKEPILSCAGGLMIEHPLTQQYVDKMDGNIESIMGLCPQTVQRLLRGLRESIL